MTKKYSCEVKLPGHPVKTGQALNLAWYRAGTPGLPGKVVSFYIVPLPAGRDPAYPANGGTGHVPARREENGCKTNKIP